MLTKGELNGRKVQDFHLRRDLGILRGRRRRLGFHICNSSTHVNLTCIPQCQILAVRIRRSLSHTCLSQRLGLYQSLRTLAFSPSLSLFIQYRSRFRLLCISEKNNSNCIVDSGAEKEVIRIAYPYLDFFIVQDYSASTNLFTFFEQLEAFNISDALKACLQLSISELDQQRNTILVD